MTIDKQKIISVTLSRLEHQVLKSKSYTSDLAIKLDDTQGQIELNEGFFQDLIDTLKDFSNEYINSNK